MTYNLPTIMSTASLPLTGISTAVLQVQAEKNTMFSISRFKLLREFLIANPPPFAISDKCCDYAKKNVSKEFDNLNIHSIASLYKAFTPEDGVTFQ